MSALVLLHRWLGVGFCLLFAMWFASGIVMHFVPFPELTEPERFEGMLPIDLSLVRHDPEEAVSGSAVGDARRVRLVQRADGPVYIVSGPSRSRAAYARDLSDASVKSAEVARGIAIAHARQRGLDATRAVFAGLADYDQWIVPNGYDGHRPLYRVALNDPPETELYVSSVSGEVVLDTTRRERVWNYMGSVAHWIYPTILRSNWIAWDKVVWTLSLVSLFAAVTGVIVGIIRLQVSRGGLRSPFRGWHAWHHVLGLVTATFVVTWIFSGWLSMDHGLLFSRGQVSGAEAAIIARNPGWENLAGDRRQIAESSKEVEWFALDDRFYRRDRAGLDAQSLAVVAEPGASRPARAFLTEEQIFTFSRRLSPDCAAPIVVSARDNYPVSASMPGAPVYRSICGDVWFHIDGATGTIISRLDPSRRTYRWLYTALHTLDFPILRDYPKVRSVLIVVLCAIGFMFSITGMVIGWRRLRYQFPSQARGLTIKAG
jgi:hypothetical protein